MNNLQKGRVYTVFFDVFNARIENHTVQLSFGANLKERE